MNNREFDYLYGDDLKQSALYKEAKLKSDELIQTIEQLNMDSTSEDDDIAVEGKEPTQFNPQAIQSIQRVFFVGLIPG